MRDGYHDFVTAYAFDHSDDAFASAAEGGVDGDFWAGRVVSLAIVPSLLTFMMVGIASS